MPKFLFLYCVSHSISEPNQIKVHSSLFIFYNLFFRLTLKKKKQEDKKIRSPYLKSTNITKKHVCIAHKKRHKIKYRRNNSSALNCCVCMCV